MIVADTNLVAYLLIEGEHTAAARQVFTRDPTWAAPLLWRSELRNVLATYLRRGSLSLAEASERMETAITLFEGNEHLVPSAKVLELAGAGPCSAYDCEYVVLAQELEIPLVTSHGRILAAFSEIAVSIEAFAGP